MLILCLSDIKQVPILTCSDCIDLSVVLNVKLFTPVCSVKTKTNADMSMKLWLNYWHRCIHICKRRLMHEINALQLNFNHTSVNAHVVNACFRPRIRKCANTENTAMTTDLMVMSYYKC